MNKFHEKCQYLFVVMFIGKASLPLFTVILLLRNSTVNISDPQCPWMCLLAFSLSSWLLENSGFVRDSQVPACRHCLPLTLFT